MWKKNPYPSVDTSEQRVRMSGRGGRGGGRGGFGGRGSSGNPITIDDDGQPVTGIADGPPSLYPPMLRMPPPPELTEREEELLRIHRRLQSFWRNSCYFLHDEPAAQEIPEVKMVTHRDKLAAREKAKTEKKTELHDVLESSREYFPEELWPSKSKKRKRGGTAKSTRAKGGDGQDGDDRLERLARLEKRREEEEVDDDIEDIDGKDAGVDEDDDENAGGKRGRGTRVGEHADRKSRHGGEHKDGKKGGDKGADDDEGEEDDYWDDDDDDYQRGADCDDDEGYDDDLGGGDDEEAFF